MEKAKKKKKPIKNHFGIPHDDYWKERELWERIKKEYFELKNSPLFGKCNIVTILSNKFNVKRPTLVGWQKMGDYGAWMDSRRCSQLLQRIFSDETEESVSDYITDNYIKPGYYFPDNLKM